ncbi:aspartate--ammonia ligase [Stylonychia lemnae]|uniref:Aspartate--ammonia ligase n=1 Tax=Stylonychia lemnae TaxID=5949 RepID=A0A077ZS39_STYLE|nr:aspartate--ammonia ligase [Stylonychia lemnae]|eukprot:CDW71286.1 aspartate--ammonia ligase [Stylonychia lemnae]
MLFDSLSTKLNLIRVQAPLFIPAGTGFQDIRLSENNKMAQINFQYFQLPGVHLEIFHSLAKRRRQILSLHEFEPYSGIYAEGHFMRVIEPEVTPTHSFLKQVEENLAKRYPNQIDRQLPENISFIHSQELEEQFPGITPKDREVAITKELGAVFLIGIGHPLPQSGQPHSKRNSDYDDWWTQSNSIGYRGLNGDILVWDSTLDTVLEISSMGIRVSSESLEQQSIIQGTWEYIKELDYHKSIAGEKFVYSIGGGIGIDRVLKCILRKRHIGDIQVGVWPEEELNAHYEYLR